MLFYEQSLFILDGQSWEALKLQNLVFTLRRAEQQAKGRSQCLGECCSVISSSKHLLVCMVGETSTGKMEADRGIESSKGGGENPTPSHNKP